MILLINVSLLTAQIDLESALDNDELMAFWKADSLFNLGEYDQAIEFYQMYEPKNHFNLGWPIKKSICYLLVEDTISAQKYFENYVINGGYYMYVAQIDRIPLFEIIAPDEVVRNKFTDNSLAFEKNDSTCLYPDVLKVLMNMRSIDQAYRQGNGDPSISLSTIDSLNRIKLDSLINIYGWLGYKEVGKSGENASFLIAQHSDRDLKFQKKCILLMEKELFKGNIYPSNFALLYDRIKVNSNDCQLFGSQVDINNESNSFEPKKTVSFQLLNPYRSYLGLGTIQSYLELMNKRSGLN